MIRTSEAAGLFAGLAFFLGTLLAAQAFMSHEGPRVAELVEWAE